MTYTLLKHALLLFGVLLDHECDVFGHFLLDQLFVEGLALEQLVQLLLEGPESVDKDLNLWHGDYMMWRVDYNSNYFG